MTMGTDEDERRATMSQHFEWLRIYLSEANERNWKDMILRCERQLDQLEPLAYGERSGGAKDG